MCDDPGEGSGRQVSGPRDSRGEQSGSAAPGAGCGASGPGQGRETAHWLRWPAKVSRRRAICLAVLLAGALAADHASGVLLWLSCGAVAVGLAGVLMPAGRSRSDRKLWSGRFASVALAVSSVFVGLALLEELLWALETAADQPLPQFVAKSPAAVPLAPELPPEIRAKIKRMQSALIMPPSWQKRDLEKIPGADEFVWQTVLHIVDTNGMRRKKPFPPRDPNRFRIMVVGDSLTYGEGNGRNFRVSRWEGHPNEEADAIWASMLANKIRGLDELAPFRRSSGAPAAAGSTDRAPQSSHS